MPDLQNAKVKHLTMEERTEIQDCLFHGMSFKAIGRRIGKDPTTVSKEVKKHIQVLPAKTEGAALCPKLLKAPFVCNGCQRVHFCRLEKRKYLPKPAQAAYRDTLSQCRTGIALSKESFYENDRVITEGIRKGQHIYHILRANHLAVSKSTFYRHLHAGYLSICAIDMPRVVKFKPRNSHLTSYIPKQLKVGRTFDCFEAFVAQFNLSTWVEMDLVIGRLGGKAIMTFNFTFCNFMFGLLLDNKAASTAAQAVRNLKKQLRDAEISFSLLFPVLLTDNGGEFSDVFAFENSLDGVKESGLFFCDPYTPSQKPHVEKNHTLFRDIAPSGSSFDAFSQETVNLIFSHVNAVSRKSLNGKSPFDLFTFAFSAEAALALGSFPVAPLDVVQSPALLKR